MTVEHGDAVRTANSGRGIHGLPGFTDVADEAARAAIVQAGTDAERVVKQTGGARPGLYYADGAGSWTFMGNSTERWSFKNSANDGETLFLGTLWIAGLLGPGTSGDYQLFMPDTSSDEVKDGDVLYLIISGEGGGIARLQLSRSGADRFAGGMGLANSLPNDLFLQGAFDLIRFTADKPNSLWVVHGVTYDYASPYKQWPCSVATNAPLPAFTPSGTGQQKILTADANGELVVDNLPASFIGQDFRKSVLVAAEGGGSPAANHGIYDIVQPGTAGTPWILRARTDFSTSRCVAKGANVRVASGFVNIGRLFTAASQNSYPTTALLWQKSVASSPVVYEIGTTLSADADDYEPVAFLAGQGEWRDVDVVKLTSTLAVAITGFAAVPSGSTIRHVINIGSFNITLRHQNAGSAAANRIEIAGGVDLVLQPGAAATLWYDFDNTIWRVI